MNAAVEIVDLPIDVALPVRERHGQDHVAPAGADRRGRDGVGERADAIFADETRQPLQHDRAIDVARASASPAAPTQTDRVRSWQSDSAPSKMLTS